jgi:hypothetical protein
MKVLVCGGRMWGRARWNSPISAKRLAVIQRDRSYGLLDILLKSPGISVLIHGDGKGADEIAARWATSREVKVEVYPADWLTHGKAAGPIRNSEMLRRSCPDVVVVFPGGVGTADMMGKALDMDGVTVLDAGQIIDTEERRIEDTDCPE